MVNHLRLPAPLTAGRRSRPAAVALGLAATAVPLGAAAGDGLAVDGGVTHDATVASAVARASALTSAHRTCAP
jgi:hypothetical protein